MLAIIDLSDGGDGDAWVIVPLDLSTSQTPDLEI
jgi:hypothetical protein